MARKNAKGICTVAGCERPHKGHGYCDPHLQRFHDTGEVFPEIPISKSIMHMKERNLRWNGGSFVIDGRMLCHSPGHPAPSHGDNYVYRYRLVTEAHIGRYLFPGEIVHHIDGNTLNDEWGNLEVTTTPDHMRNHVASWERDGNGRFVKHPKEEFLNAD